MVPWYGSLISRKILKNISLQGRAQSFSRSHFSFSPVWNSSSDSIYNNLASETAFRAKARKRKDALPLIQMTHLEKTNICGSIVARLQKHLSEALNVLSQGICLHLKTWRWWYLAHTIPNFFIFGQVFFFHSLLKAAYLKTYLKCSQHYNMQQ